MPMHSMRLVPLLAMFSSTLECFGTQDAKYLDVAEVSLLNNVLAAVNLRGTDSLCQSIGS